MLTDDEVRDTLRELDSSDPGERVLTLRWLNTSPTGTPALLPRLRELADDRTPAVLAIPYSYGEVRWLAAHALAAEYRACGIHEPIVIADVPYPVDTDTLGALADAARVHNGGHDGLLADFAELRERGLLKLTTLTL